MDQEEIRAEIERRRQKAKDLKLRETLWSLYSSQFKYIGEKLQKDPELILPEVRESLNQTNNVSDFRFNGSEYCLVCTESKQEKDGWGDDKTVTTPCAVMLKVNGEVVFEFNLRTSVTYAHDAPIFDESMGKITAFIDGAWVTEIGELLRQMRTHFQDTWKRRNALKDTEKLKQEMKRFGL